MTSAVFVWPALAALAVIVWLGVQLVADAARRRSAGRVAPPVGGLVQAPPPTFARAVRDALPEAWRAAGLRETPARPLPSISGPGRAVGDGLEFSLSAGGHNMSELRKLEERVGGALGRRVPVGLVRVRATPGRPGYGSLVVARTHPLAGQLTHPAAPGKRAPGGRGLQVPIGQTEFMSPTLVDLRKTAMWVGQNGSGKTWGVIDMLLAAVTFPTVEVTVYDGSVKAGSGYAAFGRRLRHGRVLKDRAEIVKDLVGIEASLARRAQVLNGQPWTPTRKLPLRLLVIEEFPALGLEDDDLEVVIRLAQQGRELGFALHVVSQNAIGVIVDTVLRAELRQRFVFRVSGWREADMALGEGTRGADGEDGYSPIPVTWPGVFDSVVIEESGVTRSRAFAPISSLAEAQAMWGRTVDWGDPDQVSSARMRTFVALHLAALDERVSPPQAIDLTPAGRKAAAKR